MLLQERQLIQAAPIPLEPWLPLIPDQPISDLPITDLLIDDLPSDDQPIDDLPIDDLPIDDQPITDPVTYTIWARNVETVRQLLDDLL